MAVVAESKSANLRLAYDDGTDKRTYSVSRLDPAADAASLILLAEAVCDLQGEMPIDLINRCEFTLISD